MPVGGLLRLRVPCHLQVDEVLILPVGAAQAAAAEPEAGVANKACVGQAGETRETQVRGAAPVVASNMKMKTITKTKTKTMTMVVFDKVISSE